MLKSGFSRYQKYVWLIYPLLGLAAFLLSITASVDWKNYNWLYEHGVASQTWQQLINALSFEGETLYFWSSKLFGEWIGFDWYILLLTVGLCTLKLYYYQRLSVKPWLTIFFYCCFYLFLFEGTQLRVAFATALVIPAVYLITIERPFLSLALILISSQVHLTCLVFLIVFPLYYSKQFFVAVLIAFIFSPLFILFHVSLFDALEVLANYINPRYLVYARSGIVDGQNSTGLFFYFLALFYVLHLFVMLTLGREIFVEPKMRLLLGTGLVGLFFMCGIHTNVAPATRLGELMMITMPLYLTMTYIEWEGSKDYLICYALLAFAVFYAVARFVYLYPSLVSFN